MVSETKHANRWPDATSALSTVYKDCIKSNRECRKIEVFMVVRILDCDAM
jgi:hypothetical protein